MFFLMFVILPVMPHIKNTKLLPKFFFKILNPVDYCYISVYRNIYPYIHISNFISVI